MYINHFYTWHHHEKPWLTKIINPNLTVCLIAACQAKRHCYFKSLFRGSGQKLILRYPNYPPFSLFK